MRGLGISFSHLPAALFYISFVPVFATLVFFQQRLSLTKHFTKPTLLKGSFEMAQKNMLLQPVRSVTYVFTGSTLPLLPLIV